MKRRTLWRPMLRAGCASILSAIFMTPAIADTKEHAVPMGAPPHDEPDATQIERLAALPTMLHSMQLMRDMCLQLYPGDEATIGGLYENSSVPAYAQWIGYDRSFIDHEKSRDDVLGGMTEAEAHATCFENFPAALRLFDDEYAGSMEDMKTLYADLVRDAASQPDVAASPREPSPSTADEALQSRVREIVETANLAYQTSDWSMFAALYEPGTFACWEDVPGAEDFDFLSMPPFNAPVKVAIQDFPEKYIAGGIFTNVRPTHLLELSQEQTFDWGRCGVPERKRWPKHHFYLVKHGESYGLTHYCPAADAVRESLKWAAPHTAANTAARIASLEPSEWERIPKEVRADPYALSVAARLASTYGWDNDAAMAVIDYVCDPSHSKSDGP